MAESFYIGARGAIATAAISRAFLEDTYRIAWRQEPDRVFHIDAAEALVRDGALVLRAPTGSGKTRAALLAPLAGWRAGVPLVDRLIYAVPLRSLASSLAAEARAAVGNLGMSLRVTLQMGGCEDDPLYERGHIIFTTIDQLLSRYLALPYSLGAGRANMCPGALIGALIVLDEIHLYEFRRALSTSLVMLGRHFAGSTRFLLMSATLSDASVGALAAALKCRARSVAPEEARGWPGFADIERDVEVTHASLEGLPLLRSLEEYRWPRRVIAVVNTVRRAQRLFEELRAAKVRHPYTLHLLHSRYLATDRQALEEPSLRHFGRPHASEENGAHLLVATQVVEVGLDLSCDQMRTEVAPANALVQRFGRCARWPGERGHVVVHTPEMNDKGSWRFGPYRDQDRSVRRTWEYLAPRGRFRMDAFAAGAFVDAIHGPDDQRNFCDLDLDSVERNVADALDYGDLALRRQCIRDVDAVSILVLDDATPRPDPRRVAEWVSVPRSALHALARRCPGTSVATFDFGEDGSPGWPGAWRGERLSSELIRTATLLVLPNTVAAYSSPGGLRLGEGGPPTPIRPRSDIRRPRFGYTREAYLKHVDRVLRVGATLEGIEYAAPESGECCPGMTVALASLDRLLGKAGAGALLCRLACLLHDTGKLGKEWQAWAERWERLVNPAHRPEPLAHTTFDPDAHGQLDRRFRQEGCSRPPHAVASALACESLVQSVVDRLVGLDEQRRINAADAVLSAIGRHHSPRARQGSRFRAVSAADDLVTESLRLAGITRPEGVRLADLTDERQIGRFEAEIAVRLSIASDRGGIHRAREAMLLYWAIIRYVRIADGHSQALARAEEV